MGRTLQSGVIVEVTEAEAVVSSFRMRLDPRTRLGVPAHVTVLFPFAAPEDITEELRARLRDIAASVPAFEFDLSRTDWFGEEVLWLAPDPDDQFRTLTSRATAAFPAYPAYGGQFDDVVPHLTIADRGPIDKMREAERAVQRQLPIHACARSLTLIVEHESGSWERTAIFELALGKSAR